MSCVASCDRSGEDQQLPPAAAAPLPDGLLLAVLALDAAPVALIVTALDGRCLQVNQAMCDLVGYSAAQMVGGTWGDLTHPNDLHLDQEAIAVLMSGDGRGPSIEKRFRHADGHLVWARVTAALFHAAARGAGRRGDAV